MTMTYKEAVNWINNRLAFGIKPGLLRMEWVMARLGNPHLKIKAIHVAGTNGKGSTVTYLREILQAEGLKVGTFTSPYIESFNERISVNGTPIPDEEIIHLVDVLKPLAEELETTELGAPTEFEIITAMSFLYFGEIHPMDICIYEVGLGGRLDSTNIITPLVSVITNIGFDHMNILGNTLGAIASEKAGIIKEKVPVVTTAVGEEVLQVIEKEAVEKNAPLVKVTNQDFKSLVSTEAGERFLFKNESYEITMLGQHQIINASLAIQTIQVLSEVLHRNIDISKVRQGLKRAFWLGRFERIVKNPLIILDGAHNEQGVNALVETIRERYTHKKIKILFSALGDKNVQGMLNQLKTVTSNVFITTFEFPRAMNESRLQEVANEYELEPVLEWKLLIEDYLQRNCEDEMLVITGSLYFISQVRQWILDK